MRTFVVGDLHGYVNPLKELLDKVQFDYENDRLISMGDLCDRGPDTWEVLEFLLTIKNKILIKGNHDPWLEGRLNGKQSRNQEEIWLYNGGRTAIDSYIRNKWANKEAHLALLQSQIYYHVENRIAFVHGGFDKNFLLSEHDGESMMWDRELVMQAMSCKGKKMKLKFKDEIDMVFVGHTPTLYWNESVPGKGQQPIYTPIYAGGVWNVDTGCGKGGYLTLFDLDNMTYIQSSEKCYSLNG